ATRLVLRHVLGTLTSPALPQAHSYDHERVATTTVESPRNRVQRSIVPTSISRPECSPETLASKSRAGCDRSTLILPIPCRSRNDFARACAFAVTVGERNQSVREEQDESKGRCPRTTNTSGQTKVPTRRGRFALSRLSGRTEQWCLLRGTPPNDDRFELGRSLARRLAALFRSARLLLQSRSQRAS